MKIFIALVLVILSGCAAPPPCPEFAVRLVVIEGQTFGILDAENIGRMIAQHTGVIDGSCSLTQ